MLNREIASRVADYLLQINAVKLRPANPFTWSSGWLSPIYCDNRLTLSYPEIRTFLRKEMAAAIRSQFPDANSIVGVATAGIALGALVADELGLPFAYCRPKPKEHGMKNQLEGRVDADAKVVVFEDLISTGGSSLKVVEYLRNDGIEVMGLAAVFTYGFPLAQKNFDHMACPFITLSDYSVLIEQAIRNGYVNQSSLDSLTSWRTNPDNWKPASE